ncbi:cell division protein FtsQ/DivIB [Bernardetia sp. OM2101]|uniref:cell division protein FtsQ/DivIB n=1 Tax=Bernardetia sp. OM2101 TaxID=3344876 RepID=UPI0035D0E5C0
MKISVKIILFVLSILVTIAATEVYQRGQMIQRVHIVVRNAAQNLQDTSHFLTEVEILKLVRQDAKIDVNNLKIKEIDTKKIENSIKTNNFVSTCQVAVDSKGILHIEVEELKPLARILNKNSANGAYITESGKLIPLSPNFTARVMLLSSQKSNDTELLDTAFWKTPDGQLFIDALKEIDKKPFWKAQITQLERDTKGNILAYPQVGEQLIELGSAKNMENKLTRLKTFYDKIIPVKGWGSYQLVSVRYDNQIVCK